MECPKCGSGDCNVMDSRSKKVGQRKRRYICNQCLGKFETVEVRTDDIKEIISGEWIAEMQRHYRTMRQIEREYLLRSEQLLK